MDDNFYKENLSGALWARDEIIAKFQDWWSEKEIKNILAKISAQNELAWGDVYIKNIDRDT